MKTHILTLAAIAALTTLGLADSPDAILKDYRKQATQATQRLNETLQKSAVPLVAALVKSGDTAGADELQAQLKAKISGEPVAKPQASASNLFNMYTAARSAALEPAQKSANKRIDALLAGSDSKKLEVVTELSKVRAEIEAGKVADLSGAGFPVEWTYHRTPATPAEATVFLNTDGSFLMDDGKDKRTGKWKPGKEPNTFTITYAINKSVWRAQVEGDLATVDRPDIHETRYFKVKK